MTPRQHAERYRVWCALGELEGEGVTRAELAEHTGLHPYIVNGILRRTGWDARVCNPTSSRNQQYRSYRAIEHPDTLALFN